MSDFSTPPGWYPDGGGWERRWDGSAWTDDRRLMEQPTAVRPAPFEETQVETPRFAPPAAAPSPQPPVPPGAHPFQQPTPVMSPAQGWGYAAPPPPAPRRGRAGLWAGLGIGLLVVLALVVGLLLWAPWSDDDAAGTSSGSGNGNGSGNGGTGGTPSGTPVQGDRDGNGFGDAAYFVRLDYDNTTKVVAASDGTVFTTSEESVETYGLPVEMLADWDTDGVNEVMTWTFDESGQLTLASDADDIDGLQAFEIPVSSLRDYGVSVLVEAGDVDGDGDPDVVVAAPNDKVVDLHVLANDGTGAFAEPVRWASIPNATIEATEIRAGDFDNDGDADLWARLPADKLTDKAYTEYYSGDRGYTLLRSTGSAFELGAIQKVANYEDAYLVGDVTGDGTTSLVGVTSNGYDEALVITVYDLSSGQPKEVGGFGGEASVGQRSLEGATLTDVNGDGKGDVVFVVKAYEEKKFTGVQVMTSTGSGFDSPMVWAETPQCSDDSCRITFPVPGESSY